MYGFFLTWLYLMVPAVIVFMFVWTWLYIWLERGGNPFGNEWDHYNRNC